MIEAMYHMLEKVGFVHPLHPAITHIPMGMVMGGFVFVLLFVVVKKIEFLTTAFHCMCLAFLGTFPTILLGFTDWQYRFDGAWSLIIVLKMAFALALVILILFAIKCNREDRDKPRKLLIIHGLCLALAIGLGFMGGELLFG
ncbi:MAG: hypothetical protein JEZ12_09050 [Desulfobacterium sp.]|nr:hypothetical protein [Desulfobacterium sp.]